MRSELAEKGRKDLIAAARRMSPEERLRAFAEHSRWVCLLADAGRRARAGAPRPSPSK